MSPHVANLLGVVGLIFATVVGTWRYAHRRRRNAEAIVVLFTHDGDRQGTYIAGPFSVGEANRHCSTVQQAMYVGLRSESSVAALVAWSHVGVQRVKADEGSFLKRLLEVDD